MGSRLNVLAAECQERALIGKSLTSRHCPLQSTDPMDRVNMYASTWVCTKNSEVHGTVRKPAAQLVDLSLGVSALGEEQD
jgi:hypothetical protein